MSAKAKGKMQKSNGTWKTAERSKFRKTLEIPTFDFCGGQRRNTELLNVRRSTVVLKKSSIRVNAWNVSFRNPLRWQIYSISLVDTTKLFSNIKYSSFSYFLHCYLTLPQKVGVLKTYTDTLLRSSSL